LSSTENQEVKRKGIDMDWEFIIIISLGAGWTIAGAFFAINNRTTKLFQNPWLGLISIFISGPFVWFIALITLIKIKRKSIL